MSRKIAICLSLTFLFGAVMWAHSRHPIDGKWTDKDKNEQYARR